MFGRMFWAIAGMALIGVGNMIQGIADDKKTEELIDKKIKEHDEEMAKTTNKTESEE